MSLHDHSAKLEKVLKDASELLTGLGYTVSHGRPTGSAYYGKENPHDFDVLLLVSDTIPASEAGLRRSLEPADIEGVVERLKAYGYADCRHTAQSGELGYEGNDYGETWAAVRGGDVNIILTNSTEWYIRAAAATELTRATAVKDGRVPSKEDTVDVFRICRFEEE